MSRPLASPRLLGRSVVGVVVFASVGAAACGSGPTEGPKGPELPPVPGMTLAGVTSATPAPANSARSAREEERARARAQMRAEEEARRAAEGSDTPPPEAGPDPTNGAFTLAMATAGLPQSGPIVATIKTSKGDMKCKLYEDKAPMAVANFVGLARGTRPWKSNGQWVTKPAYDGTSFHRVIKGFMIQGGDPQGTGRGEPGYVFKDELWAGAKHDRAGLLCMANRGPDTNGMQFFITDAAAAHLDKSYTIFGDCSPVSTVHTIANVQVDASDRPTQEVSIDKVEISRAGVTGGAPAPGSAPKAGAGASAPAGSGAAPPPATSGSALPKAPGSAPLPGGTGGNP